jgi:hypothetical protein
MMLEYVLIVWYKKGFGTFGIVPKIGLELRKHLSFGSWEGGFFETMKARALMVS